LKPFAFSQSSGHVLETLKKKKKKCRYSSKELLKSFRLDHKDVDILIWEKMALETLQRG